MSARGGRVITARGAERRAAILEALERLLRERPLAGIDVAELSAEAGMTRSGFYFYFPTKEAAVQALLWEIYDEMIASAGVFFAGDAPGRPQLEAVLARVASHWATHEHLLAAMIAAAATDPRAAAAWEEWTGAWVDRVAATIDAERARGVAPDGPDAHALAGVLIGTNILAFSRPGPPPLDALVSTWMGAIYGRTA